MRCTHLLGVALALGCTPPAPSAPPVVRIAARDASPPPTPPQDLAREAVFAGLRGYLGGLGGPARPWPLTLVAGPWLARERGFATPHAAALVSSPALGGGPGSITWLVSAAPGRPEVPARVTEFGSRERRLDIAEVLVRDVDGDGGDELVVVSRAAGAPDPTGDPLVTVHTVDTSLTPTWERLMLVEWQIDGSHDAPSVDAALASRGRDEAPAEGTSPERFLARLAVATPAGFRAMIDARGLQVCEPPPRGRRSRCRTAPAAALADAQVVALQRGFFALSERTGTDPSGYGLHRCRRGPDATTCSADEYTGNASLGWRIAGAGASMRLVQVRSDYVGVD